MKTDLILDLHPALQPVARRWLEKARAITRVRITETFRTAARQGEVVASGASGLAIGFHCYGLAFDFAVIDEAGVYIADGTDSRYAQFGELGRSLGLRWGGDWAKPDYDHLEYAGGLTIGEFRVWIAGHPNP